MALLPFLSKRGIVGAEDLMVRDPDDHQKEYSDRCRRIVQALCHDFAVSNDCVNIVVAHLAVVGAAKGGGQREAQHIFDYYVPADIFPTSTHYVALGHIHKTPDDSRQVSPSGMRGRPSPWTSVRRTTTTAFSSSRRKWGGPHGFGRLRWSRGGL